MWRESQRETQLSVPWEFYFNFFFLPCAPSQHTTPTKTGSGTNANPTSKLKWEFSATGGRIRPPEVASLLPLSWHASDDALFGCIPSTAVQQDWCCSPRARPIGEHRAVNNAPGGHLSGNAGGSLRLMPPLEIGRIGRWCHCLSWDGTSLGGPKSLKTLHFKTFLMSNFDKYLRWLSVNDT